MSWTLRAAALLAPVLLSAFLAQAAMTVHDGGLSPSAEALLRNRCAQSETLIAGNSMAGNLSANRLSRALGQPVDTLLLPNMAAPGWYANLALCYELGSGPRNLLVVGGSASIMATEPVSGRALAHLMRTPRWSDDSTFRGRLVGGWPGAVPVAQVQVATRSQWRRVQTAWFRRATQLSMRWSGQRSTGGIPLYQQVEREVFRDAPKRADDALLAQIKAIETTQVLHEDEAFIGPIIALARAHDTQIAFVVLPHREASTSIEIDAIRTLRTHLSTQGVPLFDLTEEPSPETWFRDWAHVNEQGRIMLTGRLRQHLVQDGWPR